MGGGPLRGACRLSRWNLQCPWIILRESESVRMGIANSTSTVRAVTVGHWQGLSRLGICGLTGSIAVKGALNR